VSKSQTYTHRIQPAVINFTKLFIAVKQQPDLTWHITEPSSLRLKHTHTHTSRSVWEPNSKIIQMKTSRSLSLKN